MTPEPFVIHYSGAPLGQNDRLTIYGSLSDCIWEGFTDGEGDGL